MARVLITGASGFIGGYLVEQALQRGDAVWATVRAGSDTTRLRDPRVNLVQLPLNNQDSMENMLRQLGRFDWVIHNAGVTKALDKKGYYEGNLGNTQRLVQALLQSETTPAKFLYVSSLAALGPAPENREAVQADQPPKPLTSYGASKLQTEQWLESLPSGFPWVVVQPTAVYGPWERDILTFIQLVNKGLELTIGTKPQQLSFVHAQDVAGAIFKILEHPEALKKKYIISDGKSYRTADLGNAVKLALGRKRTLQIKLPLLIVRPIASISEWMGRLQKKASPLNREKIPELAASNWQSDVRPLLEETQYKPMYDLNQGMAQTVQWYKKHGWL